MKSGIKSRQNRGDYISPLAIFGYRKNPTNKHQLMIDEVAAPIVQIIFQYALDGLKGVQIAKKMNELNIMTPAWYARAYKKRNYPMDNETSGEQLVACRVALGHIILLEYGLL